MLRTGAVLLGVVLVAGCASATAGQPPPVAVQRHLVYERVTGRKGIWIARVDGSRPRFLVAGLGPAISPDGKWVAYSGPCDRAGTCGDRVYVVSSAVGAKPRRLGGGAGWPMTWSPDSRSIVTALDATQSELVRIDLGTGKALTLARGRLRGWSLSPDGRKIVFALARGGAAGPVFPKIDLYVTDADGRGHPRRLTRTGDAAYPVWGPRSIAFAKLIPVKYPSPHTEFARDEIWRVQPDGTARTPISGPLPERFVQGWHCIGLTPVDWSRDGRALLASLDCEGLGKAVAVDPRTGALRSLGPGTFTIGLSQDARFALVQWGDERVGRAKQRVLIYPYAGGKPRLVARGASAPSWNR